MGHQYKPLNGLFRASATETTIGILMLQLVVIEPRLSLIAFLQLTAGVLGIAYRSTGQHKVITIVMHLLVIAYWLVCLSALDAICSMRETVRNIFAPSVLMGFPSSLAGLWFVIRTRKADVDEPIFEE